MYYYRARYYDAKMGRFISEDPIGIIPFGPKVGINHPYVYVWNNPVNWVDPEGLIYGPPRGYPSIWPGQPDGEQPKCMNECDKAYEEWNKCKEKCFKKCFRRIIPKPWCIFKCILISCPKPVC